MLFTKMIWFGLLFFCGSAAFSQTYQAVLTEGSSFILRGSSNVNKFSLVYKGNLNNADNVKVQTVSNRMNVKASKALSLKVHDFESSNSYITRDFRKMLRAETYPFLSIEPVSFWHQKDQPGIICALVNITIAGCTRQETISLSMINQNSSSALCRGSHNISLKRYQLAAPKKALGAVQVNDEVVIDMQLGIQFKKTKT